MASGEFRAVPVRATVLVLIGPLLHLMMTEHSFGACPLPGAGAADSDLVLSIQLDLMMRGLLAVPVKKAVSR
jgi:hypothetical protein